MHRNKVLVLATERKKSARTERQGCDRKQCAVPSPPDPEPASHRRQTPKRARLYFFIHFMR